VPPEFEVQYLQLAAKNLEHQALDAHLFVS